MRPCVCSDSRARPKKQPRPRCETGGALLPSSASTRWVFLVGRVGVAARGALHAAQSVRVSDDPSVVLGGRALRQREEARRAEEVRRRGFWVVFDSQRKASASSVREVMCGCGCVRDRGRGVLDVCAVVWSEEDKPSSSRLMPPLKRPPPALLPLVAHLDYHAPTFHARPPAILSIHTADPSFLDFIREARKPQLNDAKRRGRRKPDKDLSPSAAPLWFGLPPRPACRSWNTASRPPDR